MITLASTCSSSVKHKIAQLVVASACMVLLTLLAAAGFRRASLLRFELFGAWLICGCTF